MPDLKTIKLPKIAMPEFSLSNRPYYTLWYISGKESYRLDASRKGEVIGNLETIEEGCENIKELANFMDQLLDKATLTGRKIWILYEQIPTYILNVPSIQVDGVEAEMLAEVLKFEQEALTGISMNAMHLSYSTLKTEDDLTFYWLNYLPQDIFNDIVKKLKKKHCKLAGLTHPGGLPLPLDEHKITKNWLRIESWANSVFSFHFKQGEITAFQILHPEDETESWHSELDEFILNSGSVERSESFQNSMVNPLPQLSAHYTLSDNPELLFHWLNEWLSILADKEQTAIPFLKIPPQANQEMVQTVSYTIATLAFCAGLYGWHYYQVNTFQSKTENLKTLEKNIATLKKGITSAQKRKKNLEADINSLKGDLASIPKVLNALQIRPMAILKQLALGRPNDLVIEDINVLPEHVVISGVSLAPELPNYLASFLEDNLVGVGYKVLSPTKSDMVLFDRGGPWQFELQLQDQGLTAFTQVKEESK